MDRSKLKRFVKRKSNVLIPAALLTVIILTVVFGTFFNKQLTENRMLKLFQAQMSDQTESLNHYIDAEVALLNGLELSLTMNTIYDPQFIEDKLRYYVQESDYDAIYYIYPDGTCCCSDGQSKELGEEALQHLVGQDEGWIGTLDAGELETEEVFAVMVPVSVGESVMGSLVGVFSEEHFQNYFETAGISISNDSYLCSSDGGILTATSQAQEELVQNSDISMTKMSIQDVFGKVEFKNGSLSAIQENMKEHQSCSVAYRAMGELRYAIFEPLLDDWYVVTVLRGSQINKEMMGTIWITYLMLLIVLIATALTFCFLLMREKRHQAWAKMEKKHLQDTLDHDDLTGVYVEKKFQKMVCKRLTDIVPGSYCIVYLDVYKFKLVNELCGYEKGDELLRQLGHETQALAEEYDGIVGRVSGDQFVMFLPFKRDMLNQLYQRNRNSTDILPIEIFVHYGVYIIQDVTIPVSTMIDCAKMAQHAIKGNYDNYVAYYNDELREKLLKEQEIVNSMVAVLDNGEFIIYLQPQYNYKSGDISGAEALVRWNSPSKGMISPGEFIPIFETNGFIMKLDEHVWEETCRLIRRWIDDGYQPLPLSVNVSRADMLNGSVAEKLTSLIQKYDLTPDLLNIEITESAYMDNPKQLINEINKIREAGFTVEMDDFGSGYSSLNMLKDVPINVLKTDLKFLDTEGIDQRRDQILDSVIGMAHQIGLTVVAEGVETKEQADYLVNLDCNIMQGYYFSRPIPIMEFEKLVYGAS